MTGLLQRNNDTDQRGGIMMTSCGETGPPPLQTREEEHGNKGRTQGGEGGWKQTPLIPDPLVAMELTDAFQGWRGGSFEFKKMHIVAWAPQMLAKILPPDLTQKAFQQMKEMKVRDLLFLMSRDYFSYFLRQLGLGHTPAPLSYLNQICPLNSQP